ncbi:citrate lyase acyl carrier protein [Mesoplasma melaleucae]|uniref:Citrate lyase subunit gamma (Acyl carrier protein) n=1 Tax=Mesoplasma melaleucae TaxID=81459 RepID=A0A2K8NUW3_9MOLU|nr:citrate lyase acyl carrier protein [Mesoplasma melaleucae]ATZ17632.1 citrate lyase subunit gamma (acyl carrier protein) [Mesoplasma melaleucae]
MEKIIVGSVESGDLMITIDKNSTEENKIIVNSKFLNQFGDEIKGIVNEVLIENNAKGCILNINDQGAIPAVIRARTKTALERFKK